MWVEDLSEKDSDLRKEWLVFPFVPSVVNPLAVADALRRELLVSSVLLAGSRT